MGIVNYTYNRSTSGGEIITHLINASDGQGLHFDGAAGYVDLASPPDLGTKFSFEFIVQSDDWATRGQYLVDFSTSGRFTIGRDGSSSNLQIYDTGWRTFGVAPLDDGKVHHLVVTVDDTAAILYDNGNQIGTATLGATPTVDAATDAKIGAYSGSPTSDFLNGTLYRTRFFNRTLSVGDVTALFENASVPFADQYGSQTVLISVVTGLDGWDALNTWNSQTTGGSNMILSANAAGQYCRTNTALEVGKKYRLTYTAASVTGNSYFGGNWVGGFTTIHQIVAGTNTVDFTFEFATGFINDYFYCHSGGIATVTLSNLSLVEIGCVSDYDLAFANPTQSLMVQDRAGNADGTSSATGVVQVTPIEQLNTKALSIGTTAGTPADGELMIDGGGIIYNAASTRFEIAKDLKMEGAAGSKIYMRQTVGDTTSLLGELQFGNNNIDSNVAVIAAYQGGATDSGELRFYTEPTGGALTQRLTISSAGNLESSGNVGIGVTPIVGLDVHHDAEISAGFGRADDGTNYISVRTSETQNNVAGLAFMVGSTTQTGVSSSYQMGGVQSKVVNAGGALQGSLSFLTNSGDSIAERLAISSAGNAAFSNDVTVGTDDNYVLEGYATGRNVMRSVRLNITPGDVPGSNVSIDHDATAGRSFNSPALTDGPDIGNNAANGSFALNDGSTRINVDVSNAIGIMSESILIHDINSSSTSEVYFTNTTVTSSDLSIAIFKRGSQSLVDWRTIMDAGDSMTLLIAYVSSS